MSERGNSATDKPELFFITLYRHHTRYFSNLIGEKRLFRGILICSYRFLWPFWIVEQPTENELEVITRYSIRKKRLAWSILKIPFIFAGFLLLQRLIASIAFSNSFFYFKTHEPMGIVLWNGQNLLLAAEDAAARRWGKKTFYFENGPLPNTTMIDTQGINYKNSFPRDPEFFRRQKFKLEELKQLLDTDLVPRTFRKGKKIIPGSQSDELPKKYYFMPFQTYNDTQVLLFSPWIHDMEELTLQVVSVLAENPRLPALVIKEHPSCRKNYDFLRYGMADKVLFANELSTKELILNSQGVITINSSVGVESILLDRPVLTLGQAFYNIPDLVLHADNPGTLADKLNILSEFRPDRSVRDGFLYFLRYHYLTEGTWRFPTEEHLRNVERRIELLFSKDDYS